MANRSKLPIVVVDIDNTVANHFNRIKDFYDPISKSVPYEKAFSPDVVSSFEIIPGAVDGIQKISKQFQIYWLTARKHHLIDVTKEWLITNNFIIDKLIFVKYFNDKIPHLIKIKPKLFIDDLMYDWLSLKPKQATLMVSQLLDNNIPYCAFRNNWDEILEILNCK